MILKNIHTDRLMLVPVTLDITQSLLGGKNNDEIEKLGLKTDKYWPTQDTMDILPIINNALEKDKTPSGFEFWMIVKKDNMCVIGDIGFHGKPNEKGEVEVGYGLVELERGNGYGFESLKAIMEWLSSMDCVKIVKADCLINNKPSARVLEKVGLREVSRDKELIYWEYMKPEEG
jgi:ribosomal-protein-alanine N-acetyltransferase